MEHPLNGQYVLGCQLLHYKLCWLFHSYFIINLVSIPFACKHICLQYQWICNSALGQVFPEEIKKEGEQRIR